MIDELSTFLCFGYYSDDLTKGSCKKIWAMCDDCGKYRLLNFQKYNNLCKSCGRKGKRSSNFGKILSKETKQKIGDFNRGKKISIETRKKISKALSGEKNHNWNPNKTDEERLDDRSYPEYREWRRAIFERDNYTCQVCRDNKGGNLNAHHLEGYTNNPELRIILSNGITICEICHKNFHHIYSYQNNTKEQFIKFIGEYNEN